MQFRVMLFGLHSALATSWLLDTILGPELKLHVLVYLDDIIVASCTFEDHLRHLGRYLKVFRRLRQALPKPQQVLFLPHESETPEPHYQWRRDSSIGQTSRGGRFYRHLLHDLDFRKTATDEQ